MDKGKLVALLKTGSANALMSVLIEINDEVEALKKKKKKAK